MKARPEPEKSRTIEKSRKRGKRGCIEHAEFTETNISQEKTANRRNKSRLKEKSQPRQESRYLKNTPRSKNVSAKPVSKSNHRIPTLQRATLQSKSKKSSAKVQSRLFYTESNEVPLDLDDSSALGNGMIQDALESTKFVESKYLEVLARMQDMKKRDKKFSETRVRTIESTVDKLTKENENLKYQLSNLHDAIVERKEDSNSKKQSTARDIELSIKRFEEKEDALYSRIKDLEQLVKQSGILNPKQQSQPENRECSTSNSCSKTTVNHGLKREKTSPPKRQSLLSNKTYNERTPSPYNFKRLLNQAAEQLLNDPFVGQKATSSKAQRNPQSYKGSGAQASLRDAGFSNQQLLMTHDTPDHDAIESVKNTVTEMVREFKGMRRERREVSSKLSHIEKILEK
jgi:hypothetical protein